MAITAPRVLVESTAYQNQQIGVARVYEGAQTASAIVQGANDIAGLAFRFAAEDAQTQGTEMAQSVAQTDVMAIDPSTGEPVALNQMQGMGRIGSEAYRNVINARFQQSIEEEIRNQAQILSAQYENSADGVSLYSDAMGSYISAMSQNATGQWRTFIEDTGTSYLNRTRTALAVRQMRAQRAAMASATTRANAEAATGIRTSFAQLGLGALGEAGVTGQDAFTASMRTVENAFAMPLSVAGDASPLALQAGDAREPTLSFGSTGIAGAINHDVSLGISQSVEAGILDANAFEGWTLASRSAALTGFTEHVVNQTDLTDPGQANRLDAARFAIRSGNIPALIDVAPEFLPFASMMATDPLLMEEVATDLNGILQNAADLSGILSAPRREEERAAAALAASNLALEAEAAAEAAEATAEAAEAAAEAAAEIAASNFTLTTEAIAADINFILPQTFAPSNMYLGGVRAQVLATVENAHQSALSATTQEDRDAFLERRDDLVGATIEAMARGLAASTTRDGVAMLRAQVLRGGGYDTQQGRIAEQMLQRLERIAPGSRDAFRAQISGYQEDLAHEQNVLEEQSAQFVRDNILPDLAALPFMSGATLTQEVTDLVGAINATPNLRESDRVVFGRDVYVSATRGALNEAYLQLTSENQLIVAGQYLSGASAGQTLPAPVRDALDRARQYSIQTGQDRLLTTESNSIAANRRALFRRQQENNTRLENAAAARLGINPDGSDDAVLEMVNYELAQAGGSPLQSVGPMFFASPQNMSQFPNAFQTVFDQPGLEPTGLLTIFSAAANGGNIDAHTLTMWREYRRLETSSGIFPRSISGMSDQDIAAMDLMLELSNTMPIASLPAIAQAARTYLNENRGEVLFDGRTAAQIVDGIDAFQELMPGQQQAVLAHTEYVMSIANTTAGTVSSRRDLESAITRMIDQSYTLTDGNVMEITPNGDFVNRSAYAPQRFLGEYTDRWYDLIRNDLAALTDAPVVFAGEIGGNVMYESRQLRQGGIVLPSTSQEFFDDLLDGTRYITLVPIGRDSLGGMSYSVYQVNNQTLQIEPVVYTSGDLQGLTVQVSTAEENILNIMQVDTARENAQQLELGQLMRDISESPPEISRDGFSQVFEQIGEAMMNSNVTPTESEVRDMNAEIAGYEQELEDARERGDNQQVEAIGGIIAELRAERLAVIDQLRAGNN